MRLIKWTLRLIKRLWDWFWETILGSGAGFHSK
jgi:hypothetical protein